MNILFTILNMTVNNSFMSSSIGNIKICNIFQKSQIPPTKPTRGISKEFGMLILFKIINALLTFTLVYVQVRI